jgi:hypothetical protein
MVMTCFRKEQNKCTFGNWCPSEYPHIRFPDLLHEIRWNVVLGSTLLICPVELVSVSVSSLIYIKLRSCVLFFFKADNRKGKWLVVIDRQYSFLFLWRKRPSGAWGNLIIEVSGSHTIRHTHTPGRTPPNEWSAHRRDRYIRSNKKRETNVNTTIGIQTRDPSNQAAEDLRLRPLGYRDRLFLY